MRIILAPFFILASFLLASFMLTPALAQQMQADTPIKIALTSQLRKTDSAHVVDVLAPNTVQLSNGQIIRLAGLHFPDYTARETGPFALTALKILKDMLNGKKVDIYQTPNSKKGRQNRMGQQIAHLLVTDGQLWVQGTALSLGLAQVQTSQRNPEMSALMYAHEKEARKDKIGIWESEGNILSPDEANRHLNSFQIVEGKIESVALKKNRLYINFGKNWRDDFTVSIAPADQRLFSQAGLDPLQWGGKRIRVRGWLDEYNGPYIEVNHPQAIEILDKNSKLQAPTKPPMMGTISSNR